MLKIWLLAATAVIVMSSPTSTEDKSCSFRLYQGQSRFAVSMIKSLSKNHPRSNLFFSPHTIYRTLIRAYIGSGGAIKKSLKNALFLDWSSDENDVADAYKMEKLARAERFSGDSIHFKSVDKFFVTRNIMLNPRLKEVFTFSEIVRVDFSDPEARRAEMNAFVKKYTKYINELLPINSVQDNGNFFLVNAAFFKGFLEKPFDVKLTEYQNFYGASEGLIEMMYTIGSFNYAVLKKENATVLEMPFKGENGSVSMLVFLPTKSTPTAVDDFLDNLSSETFETLTSKMSTAFVDVNFPKIHMKSEFLLKDVLDGMGIKGLFVFNSFSNIIHKTATEVSEVGTSASTGGSYVSAASNSGYEDYLDSVSSFPSIKKFHCNRPFVYAIFDRVSQEVLFAGVYRGPDSKNLSI